MKNILNIIFPEKNENFIKAKIGLNNIKKKFDNFTITFPDITPNEIIFLKEKWEVLPRKISRGVKVMALSIINGGKSAIYKYNPHSYIMPHKHHEYEYGMILKGELIDKLSGVEYKKGDKYTFNPDELHYLTTSNNECIVYSVLSSNPDFKFEKLTKQIKNSLNLT